MDNTACGQKFPNDCDLGCFDPRKTRLKTGL